MPEEKRDYYEVLGVQKGASSDEIKKHTEKQQRSIIPILILMTKLQKKNSKNATKLMRFFQTLIKKHDTISSALRE